ncbi:D-2-hydroxyacid dehydrogenase [Magnetospira sp. QH-2]|uniref:D-2-hydroxyacid dehydrogenase n=1 Tax=Magnetospira sp. (strain QH-2) TaxID=1288970 RepID=UPI0003E80A46|nr:D-2-hydroxyacid dehydrogenase [Magnetospira sp. QH-2]CCQ74215.1 Glycerate dehydrogenase [Magnetospira sp. QH-2]
MTAHTIVFLDRDTIAPQINLRHPAFDHQWVEHDRTSVDQVIERLAGATVCINNKVPLRREILEQLPNLELIAMAATGTDCIDKEYCAEAGITLSNIRGYADHTVPEHTFALILAFARQILAYRQDVIDGKWIKADQFCFFDHTIWELHGKRLGIIGKGSLGTGVAALAKAFGMKPMFAAHKGSTGMGAPYTPWDDVLETADVLTLHCPLTPATKGLLGWTEFQAMKKRPLIVNTARGGLINDDDLVRALDENLIRGAAIDVSMPEPPTMDHPMMRIADRPNVIFTPHVAWASDEAMQALADQLIDNIENFVRGEPSNVVTHQ